MSNSFVLMVQGRFVSMAEGKMPPVQVQPVTTTMCASGVPALVDRRITAQVQGAKVRTECAGHDQHHTSR